MFRWGILKICFILHYRVTLMVEQQTSNTHVPYNLYSLMKTSGEQLHCYVNLV